MKTRDAADVIGNTRRSMSPGPLAGIPLWEDARAAPSAAVRLEGNTARWALRYLRGVDRIARVHSATYLPVAHSATTIRLCEPMS